MAINVSRLSQAQLIALSIQIKRRQEALSEERIGKLRKKIVAMLRAAGLTPEQVLGSPSEKAVTPIAPSKLRKAMASTQAKVQATTIKSGVARAQQPDRSPRASTGPAKAKSTEGRVPKGRKGVKLGKVAPKFRNPANPAETWAGRGLRPRWFVAALASGKKEAALGV